MCHGSLDAQEKPRTDFPLELWELVMLLTHTNAGRRKQLGKWHAPVTSVLGLRQEDYKVKLSLSKVVT